MITQVQVQQFLQLKRIADNFADTALCLVFNQVASGLHLQIYNPPVSTAPLYCQKLRLSSRSHIHKLQPPK